MNENLTKIAAFEYVLYQLNEWYKENNPTQENDLSILKAMKLLFFVSGVDIASNLFGTFNRFQAWQYGHVEADLYSKYSQLNGKFNYLEISREKTILKLSLTEFIESISLPDKLKSKIDDDIEKLKEKNKELINYKASRLVNLSHAHYSCDIYHNRLNQPYTDMDIRIITNEPKYYK